MTCFNRHACLFLTGVLALCLLGTMPAIAQSPGAPFADPSTASQSDPVSSVASTDAVATEKTADASADRQVNNPYLDTFMKLQRQNAVLAQMLERERSVADMVSSYKKMGVAYTAPKPDLQTCLELPKNLSCALAYPDRYADFLPPPAPLPAVPVIPVAVGTDELPQAIAMLSPDSALKNLMWTDITCLQGSCRAVITPDPGDPAARYSVKAGDALPPGGTVDRISATGITIVNGKSIIHVPAAPARSYAM